MNTRRRIAPIYFPLVFLNLAAWAWSLAASHHVPALLTIAFLACLAWAMLNPLRKLRFNMTIAFVSLTLALAAATIESPAVIPSHLNSTASFHRLIDALNDHLSTIALVIVSLFAITWTLTAILYRIKWYARLELDDSRMYPPEAEA